MLRSCSTRLRLGTAAAGVAVALVPVPAAAGSDDPGPDTRPDLPIVTNARVLAMAEVRAGDITETATGQQALARAADRGIDTDARGFRVYRFGEHTVTATADTVLLVRTGLDETGQTVYEVGAVAQPAEVTGQAGMVSPPKAAWRYNNDGTIVDDVGTWTRDIWWTLNKANDWKSCPTCTEHDYWRVHGKLRAGVLSGSGKYEGYKRAWLEFNRANSGWPSTVVEFETAQPSDSFKGPNDGTETWGFGQTWGFNMGVPPLTASMTWSESYGGSMSSSSENWHPVQRAEVSSGGVQYCRFTEAEYLGTRSIATRLSARIGKSASMGGWGILWGMNDENNACPPKE